MNGVFRWVLALLSLGVVGYSLFSYWVLEPGTTVHPAMKATYGENPIRILVHVTFSALALVTGPWQFFPALRRNVCLHRALGLVYFAGVAVGGVAGLATAGIAFGGLVARVGFGLLALVWLGTALAALLAIKRRDFVAHERWAQRSFALTFAAVTLRIYLGLFFAAGVAFEDSYPVVAWLCWVPNLLWVDWWLQRRRRAG